MEPRTVGEAANSSGSVGHRDSEGIARCLLALLHDPVPPALTCIEEIDHGLHPQALRLIVERLRDASAHSQFIVATHSPALADRLRPEEFVICERDDEGASLIPAITEDKEELKRRLGSPAFHESDGPKVAEKARSLRLLASGPDGTNRSYEDFVQEIGSWTRTGGN